MLLETTKRQVKMFFFPEYILYCIGSQLSPSKATRGNKKDFKDTKVVTMT